MRCNKCGSYLDDNLNTCPVCGNVFKTDEEDLGLEARLSSMIDKIMSEEADAVPEEDDGIEMREGHMEVKGASSVSDTQEFKIPDTVFEGVTEENLKEVEKRVQKGKQDIGEQYHWKDDEWEELDDEAMLEQLRKGSGESFASQRVTGTSNRRTVKSEPVREQPVRNYNKNPRVRAAKKAPGRSHAGLVVLIIVLVLLAAAVTTVIVTGVYKQWFFFWEQDTDKQASSEDVLSCNVENGMEYSLPLEITLASQAGNRIYYTLDGSEPSVSSLKYNDPIVINKTDIDGEKADYVLKAVSYTSTSIKKAEISITFTVRKADIAEPQVSLPGGHYSSVQGITLTAEKGADIYYTYDAAGTVPSKSSTLYSGTIEMLPGTNILSAIAVNGDRVSQVMKVTYTLELTVNFSYTDAYNKVATKLSDEGYEISQYPPEKTTTKETTTAKETTKETTTSKEDRTETTKETTTTAPTTTAQPKVTTAVLSDGGTVTIDNAQYYVIWVQLYYSNGYEASGMYYGVDSTTGAIVRLANNNGTFTIS